MIIAEINARYRENSVVHHPAEVAISEHDGTVTLRGTVASPRQRGLAADLAHSLPNVRSVENELSIDLLDHWQDHEIRGSALQALILADDVPDDRIAGASLIGAHVRRGVPTLRLPLVDAADRRVMRPVDAALAASGRLLSRANQRGCQSLEALVRRGYGHGRSRGSARPACGGRRGFRDRRHVGARQRAAEARVPSTASGASPPPAAVPADHLVPIGSLGLGIRLRDGSHTGAA
jgi:hypothetical protein